MADLSILIRCSDDDRVFKCIDSIDHPGDIVVSITPNPSIESRLAKRGVRFALSPKGNPAVTTMEGLRLCRNPRVLLLDSDCVLRSGSISRLLCLSKSADIVRSRIHFDAPNLSSGATALAREFQYTYCGFVYEPGLLLDLDSVLPRVGGYLFSKHAPFTPDGEFDYRVRGSGLRIATDHEVTLDHAALSFFAHLKSYWRYGMSEASRMAHLNQRVLADVVRGLPERYRSVLDNRYRVGTFATIVVSDAVYLASMIYHTINPARFPKSADLLWVASVNGNQVGLLQCDPSADYKARASQAALGRPEQAARDGVAVFSQSRAYVEFCFANPDASTDAMCGNALLALAYLLRATEPLAINGAGDMTGCSPEVYLRDGRAVLSVKRPTIPAAPMVTPFGIGCMIDVGTPHAVVSFDDVDGASEDEARSFVADANVNLTIYREEPNRVIARSFERGGVSQTASCGSGALAVGIAVTGQRRRDLTLSFPGGDYFFYCGTGSSQSRCRIEVDAGSISLEHRAVSELLAGS